MKLFTLSLSLVAFLASVPAAQEIPPESGDGGAEAGEVPPGFDPDSGMERVVTANENEASLKGLLAYAAPILMTKPSRIAPGQSGEIFVILALQGDAVIQSGNSMEFKYESEQGPIMLGSFQVNPPKPGKLASVFKDQPVHDNTATVRIPITVGSNARYGDYPVGLAMEIEVSDGKTGSLLGRYHEVGSVSVVVGRPEPRPAPRVAPAKVAAAPTAVEGSAKPDAAVSKTKDVPQDQVQSGDDAMTDPAVVPAAADEGAAGEVYANEGGNLLLYGAGGLLLIMVGLILLRKKA